VLYQKIETVLNNIRKQRKAFLDLSLSNLQSLNVSETNLSNSEFSSLDEKYQLYQLTSREKEIISLILEGIRYKAIAKALFISEKTVSKHIQNIFEKVEVTNKVELINKLKS